MPPPPLPANPTTAFHSLVRRLFTQSAHEPTDKLEDGVFFLFNVFNELVHRPSSYRKYSMTPEYWVHLNQLFYHIRQCELAVFFKIASQIFALDYDIRGQTMIVRHPSETQHRFAHYLALTIDEQLHMAQHRHPDRVARIGEYDPNDYFPQRHVAVGVPPHWTADGDWMYTVRTPNIIMRDSHTDARRPFYPLVIEICDDAGGVKHGDEEAFARDYLAGDDDRASMVLSLTLWRGDDDGSRVGTFSLWRSRKARGQRGLQAVGGYWPRGMEYVAKRLVKDRAFTAVGGGVDADAEDGRIWFSFAELSARCEAWTRFEPVGTADHALLNDGISVSFERLAHIWQLARDRQNYVVSREYLLWEEECWEEIHGLPGFWAE